MLDLSRNLDPMWPERLKPRGEGDHEKESFDAWWDRHQHELGHLHRLLCEQWVHRHWHQSRFAFIPLQTVTWKLVTMTGEEVLHSVRREFDLTREPGHDYGVFSVQRDGDQHPTGAALDKGTWDYPLVCLSTPEGIWTLDRHAPGNRRAMPDVRLVVVEGHKRHRYLDALHHRGLPPQGPHQVFIISSPLASTEGG